MAAMIDFIDVNEENLDEYLCFDHPNDNIRGGFTSSDELEDSIKDDNAGDDHVTEIIQCLID